jgi:hypothetical protein
MGVRAVRAVSGLILLGDDVVQPLDHALETPGD